MRIVSLLPSATEIVAALGLLSDLVGVSHECDFPPAVNALPRVLRCPIHNAGLSSAEIDRRVRESLARGESLYEIDIPLLTALAPDLILSQMLCDVCAIGYGTVAGVVATLPKRPVLLNLEPRCLADLYANIRLVAEHASAVSQGEAVVAGLRKRVADVAERLQTSPQPSPWKGEGASPTHGRPRVLFLEWIDPLFCAGHWTPELIDIAGGVCVAGTAGAPSARLDWKDAVAAQPDVVVIACCGYSVERTREDLPILTGRPGWDDLPAVRAGDVYLIDGSHYFNRPGPRLIDSLEMLAATLHPNAFADYDTRNRVFRLSDGH